MFKVNNKDSRTTPVIVKFEHISHLVLVFLLLTLNLLLLRHHFSILVLLFAFLMHCFSVLFLISDTTQNTEKSGIFSNTFSAQQRFACSKSTKESPEQYMKSVQS